MKRNYTKYTKELLEPLVKESFSFSNVCKLLGIKPIGSNPTTIRRKLEKYGMYMEILILEMAQHH